MTRSKMIFECLNFRIGMKRALPDRVKFLCWYAPRTTYKGIAREQPAETGVNSPDAKGNLSLWSLILMLIAARQYHVTRRQSCSVWQYLYWLRVPGITISSTWLIREPFVPFNAGLKRPVFWKSMSISAVQNGVHSSTRIRNGGPRCSDTQYRSPAQFGRQGHAYRWYCSTSTVHGDDLSPSSATQRKGSEMLQRPIGAIHLCIEAIAVSIDSSSARRFAKPFRHHPQHILVDGRRPLSLLLLKTGRPNKAQRKEMFNQRYDWEEDRREQRLERRLECGDWISIALSDLKENRHYLDQYGVEGFFKDSIAKLQELDTAPMLLFVLITQRTKTDIS
ncbi:uncharacterized protein MYCFIDRAFT_174653 [Pseudocercospora fijiensis CIRAD86]|uniref:Uncharacterized protein n=1 Tax=Pseudocercospora fijiensis (strain CIRAD86) TaxID=383855 RepID=M2ZW01_PSEFD|nr:uncharacterized protein MYCFIDRAFT_174653 [Pseudocercospora fijiensis CIRAD86]EME83174.1 hypothetical protein MYCFIDRAFT_174653 [Pseudocercospora fijiensis CIRAD86]